MSTYNKSLPKPTGICFMSADRKTRRETITMPFGGVIPSAVSYMGWRQSSYSYGYQVQYMVKARLKPDKQLETGADYTKTAWKYPNASWGGDVNSMNRCVAPDLKNRYYRYMNFSGKSLMTKGSYDKLEISVRVRSFSKKNQYGPWVTEKLTVKCVPNVTVHKIVAIADGGFRVYLNTHGWKRGDSKVILKDVRHQGKSKAQNKKTLSDEVGAIGTEEASGFPFAEFKGNLLNTDFKEDEKIIFKNCVFRTVDGVDVSLDGTYTIDPVSAVIDAPVVVVDRNENTGRIDAVISKGDSSDDWDTVKAWLNCTVRDDIVRIDPAASSGTDDNIRNFYFYPPLDCKINLCVSITNNLGGKITKKYAEGEKRNLERIPSRGRVIVNYTDGEDEQPQNGVFNGSKLAVMNYDVSYSTDASRAYEKELPFGRKRPVAFLGEGLENTINIKGNIDGTEDGEYKTEEFSGYQDWLDLQELQGIVLVRLPNGRMYTGICESLTIDQDDEFDESRIVSMKVGEIDL